MKTIFVIAIILLCCSCSNNIDSIHNHKGEVVVLKEACTRNTIYITTRVKQDSSYVFTKFRIYNAEALNLSINDTIKLEIKF